MRGAYIILILSGLLFSCRNLNRVNNTVPSEGHNIIVNNGVVVSAHSEASRIGTRILMKGGNAVDAAVATEFALAVCYPVAGNIGGGGFMLIRNNNGSSEVIDFREKAPLKAGRNMYLDENGNIREGQSTSTHLASGVPGTVDGMLAAHSKYGRISFEKVIQPSIDLAENGFRITASQAASLNDSRETFIKRNRIWPAFVRDSAWREGDLLVQKDLAGTLKLVRDYGREGFYSGKTAEMIENEMKRGQGLISAEDLSDYHSQFRKTLISNYRGFNILTVPPPSAGGIILIQLLKMIEKFPVQEWGFHSANSLHLFIEAERRAFADRAEFSGDPDFVKVPVIGLTDDDYIASRMAGFNSEKATPSSELKAGTPSLNESMETTHFSVVDMEGNAVSVTTTLNGGYGNSIVVEGAGFLLNNEMDDFSTKPGFPNMFGLTGGEANSIQPGKRMLSSMTPVIVEKQGKLFLIAGSPGGSTIPTSVFQVVINTIDYGMDLRAAVDTPRFHHQWLPDNVSFEADGIDSLTLARLTGMGHLMKPVAALGRVNAIIIRDNGLKEGVGDKRGNNSACGY